MWDRKVIVDGKLLLRFVKDKRPQYHEYIHNSIESTPPDKADDDDAQSTAEGEYIISYLTVEDQVVLDPVMGSGTTDVAAIKLNRKFIGIEINENTFNIAKSRITEFLKDREKS